MWILVFVKWDKTYVKKKKKKKRIKWNLSMIRILYTSGIKSP